MREEIEVERGLDSPTRCQRTPDGYARCAEPEEPSGRVSALRDQQLYEGERRVVDSADENRRYYYWLKAINLVGDSGFSKSIDIFNSITSVFGTIIK